MKDYTLIYAGGRVVGKVRGNMFFKSVRGSKHFLRTPRAIALDVQNLTQAEKAGAVHVHVTDSETGITYRASIEHIRWAGFLLNRGFGNQIALPMEGWITTRRGEIEAEQLSLFGQGA